MVVQTPGSRVIYCAAKCSGPMVDCLDKRSRPRLIYYAVKWCFAVFLWIKRFVYGLNVLAVCLHQMSRRSRVIYCVEKWTRS